MATPVLDNLNLSGNQLLNALAQVVATDPSSPAAGQFWFNSTSKLLKFYDGVSVQALFEVGQSTTPNGTAGGDLSGSYPNPTLTASANVESIIRANRLDQLTSPGATVNFNSQTLTGLANPVNGTDAVNYTTLLSSLSGLSSRAEVAYATATALPANTYNNGTSGVGATLTATSNGALSVDGQAVLANMRILVKNEAAGANNGLYVVTATGSASAAYVLTRSTDANTASQLGPGMLIPVEAPSNDTAGTTNNGSVFISLAPTPVVVGTSSLTFTTVGMAYSAGTGLTLTGNQFALAVPVTVANGGTGATGAAAARSNLGAVGKYAATIGNGTATAFTVNHGLNTTDVIVQVYQAGSPFQQTIVDTFVVDANDVSISFANAPATNSYRVVVTG